MALTGALSLPLFGACGVTNKSLRALTARLLGTGYSSSQMTYDLRRLHLNGLIRRIEHTHAYALTHDGRRIAIFYTKLFNRLLRPLAADQPRPPRTTAGTGRDRPPRRRLHRPSPAQTRGLKHDPRIQNPEPKSSLRSVRDFARKEWPCGQFG
jgi:hypothetical protein